MLEVDFFKYRVYLFATCIITSSFWLSWHPRVSCHKRKWLSTQRKKKLPPSKFLQALCTQRSILILEPITKATQDCSFISRLMSCLLTTKQDRNRTKIELPFQNSTTIDWECAEKLLWHANPWCSLFCYLSVFDWEEKHISIAACIIHCYIKIQYYPLKIEIIPSESFDSI